MPLERMNSAEARRIESRRQSESKKSPRSSQLQNEASKTEYFAKRWGFSSIVKSLHSVWETRVPADWTARDASNSSSQEAYSDIEEGWSDDFASRASKPLSGSEELELEEAGHRVQSLSCSNAQTLLQTLFKVLTPDLGKRGVYRESIESFEKNDGLNQLLSGDQDTAVEFANEVTSTAASVYVKEILKSTTIYPEALESFDGKTEEEIQADIAKMSPEQKALMKEIVNHANDAATAQAEAQEKDGIQRLSRVSVADMFGPQVFPPLSTDVNPLMQISITTAQNSFFLHLMNHPHLLD